VDALALPTDKYINRELSLLEFNRRVLDQVTSVENPVLERLRFLCISCTNLDEFFEVRVAALKQRLEIGAPTKGPDTLTPQQLLAEIHHRSLALINQQYEMLNQTILPALASEQIHCPMRRDWTAKQQAWLKDYFHKEILPVLTPIMLDPSRPFPRILNKSLNFIVRIDGKDAFGRRRHSAIVQAPRSLPRIIRLPDRLCEPGSSIFVFLSSIIHANVDGLFPEMTVEGCYQFRLTRNSNLYVDEEEVDDLVHALEGQLAASRYGAAVRLEISHLCPPDLCDFLLNHFSLEKNDLFAVDGPVNLNRLAAVCDMADRPDLCYPKFTPGLPRELKNSKSIFSILRKRNVLLQHPFQSFTPIVDLVAAAAIDPKVLAIKQTLYRTSTDSPIVKQLVDAATAGKEVTAIIELMARFDEAANISLANRLQEAGAHVVFGLVGFKTHAKMLLIVRREQGKMRRYVHLGTGNYHPDTARVYTDYSYFSGSQKLGEDVHKVFLQLTSLTAAKNLDRILTAPFQLFDSLIERIERETAFAIAGKKARIIAKINALTSTGIIDALYRASQAGVKIDLIVRGICSLRPGVTGYSDNIRVRSIIGRFLEHSRVYYFLNDGKEEFFCSSADWMDRNFFRRTETCFPIRQQPLKKRLKADLELFLADNCNAWELREDASYQKLLPGNAAAVSAQNSFLKNLSTSNAEQPIKD
jgi:polyphosphate kinase